MRITKFGHAGVRIEHDGRAVLIDPGVFTQEESLDGVDAVLVTHEHPDHYDPARLRLTSAPVFTIVSHATRARLSCARMASRTASEIWSAILSG